MAKPRTARQRAALRKAQLASARKRKGKKIGKMRKGARKVASGYRKYEASKVKAKNKIKAKISKTAKKYPKTTRALTTGAVVAASATNYMYYRHSPVILGPHGHPIPNPFKKR